MNNNDEIDIDFYENIINTLPSIIILPVGKAIRNIESIFPNDDVSPILTLLIDAFIDSSKAIDRLKKIIAFFLEESHDGYSKYDFDNINNSIQKINGIDRAILFEQSCLDIYDVINKSGIRIANRILCYRFHSIGSDDSLFLRKHYNFEEFCDEFYGT